MDPRAATIAFEIAKCGAKAEIRAREPKAVRALTPAGLRQAAREWLKQHPEAWAEAAEEFEKLQKIEHSRREAARKRRKINHG